MCRDELLAVVWGHHGASLSRAVDCAVKRTRRKLELPDGVQRTLLTVHGVGYRLVGRESAVVPAAILAKPTLLRLGHLDVDLDTGELHGVHRRPLTAQQLVLLRVLAEHPDRPISPCVLARRLGLPTHARRPLHTAVYRLRQAIEPVPADPRLVVFLRGRGLMLRTPDIGPKLTGMERTLWRLASHVGAVLGFEDCVIYARDGHQLVQAAAWGPKATHEGTLREPLVLRLGEGIVGAAAARAQAIYAPDTASDARYVPDTVAGRSEIAVPIEHNGVVVGIIDSEARAPEAFDSTGRAALQSVASLAGAALADLWSANPTPSATFR